MFIFGSASEYDLALQFIELSKRYFFFNSSELNLPLKKVLFFDRVTSHSVFALVPMFSCFPMKSSIIFFQGEQTLALFPPFCFFFVLFCFVFCLFVFFYREPRLLPSNRKYQSLLLLIGLFVYFVGIVRTLFYVFISVCKK